MLEAAIGKKIHQEADQQAVAAKVAGLRHLLDGLGPPVLEAAQPELEEAVELLLGRLERQSDERHRRGQRLIDQAADAACLTMSA